MTDEGTVTITQPSYGDTLIGDGQVLVTIVEEVSGATTENEPVERTTVINLGVEGPPGPSGPESSPLGYELIGATSFTATHDRAWLPSVWFVDSTGTPIVYSVTYPDSTHVHVVFPTPFTGTMYLR